MRRIIYLIIFFLVFPFKLHAQGVSVLNGVDGFSLPSPGKMISTTDSYAPALVKGVKIYPAEPFRFDFIIDRGQDGLEAKAFQEESKKLVKYFLASLTIPEDELWVNLSPYEENKIIAKGFGQTEMGRDLLGQDYILKQLSASLLYPEKELGKNFWDSVLQKAKAQYGITEIPFKTFNKVWIVPEDPIVYQNGDYAYVVSSKLKVMLEEDYLALKNSQSANLADRDITNQKSEKEISQLTSEMIREMILPAIEKEVNEGKNFAQLRQIQNSLVLAVWYKKTLAQSLLTSIYVDKNKTSGIDLKDKEISEKIYQKYLEAFKKGVYDYVKEEYDAAAQETIPRKYFSGGYSTTTEKGNLKDRMRVVSSVAQVPESERIGFVKYLREVEKGASAAVIVDVKLASVGSSGIKQQYSPKLDAWKGFTAESVEQLQEDMQQVDLSVKSFFELKEKIREQDGLISEKNNQRQKAYQDWSDLQKSHWELSPLRLLPKFKSEKERLGAEVKGLDKEITALKADQATKKQEMSRLQGDYSSQLKDALERGFKRFDDLERALVSDEGLYTDFNESLIAKYVMPNLQSLQSQGKISAELADEYLSLVREDLKEGPLSNYANQEARDRRDQRSQRLGEINRQYNELDVSWFTRGQLSSNRAYLEIIELIIKNERARWAEAVVEHARERSSNEDFSAMAEQTIQEFFTKEWDRDEYRYDGTALVAVAKKGNEKTLAKYFVDKTAKIRWEALRTHALIMSIFGAELFDGLMKDLADTTIDQLLVAETHQSSTIDLGFRLFGLAEQSPSLRVQLAPYLIINSWREPGYSGEWPFIYIHDPGNKTKLYEFVASLTDVEITALRAQNIPGLMQIIDTILGYPENFTSPQIVDPDWTRFANAFNQKGFKSNDTTFGKIPASVNDISSEYPVFEFKIWDDKHQEWVSAKDEVDKILASLGLQADILSSKDHLIANPAYQAIQQGLTELFKAYVQDENEDRQFFVMGLLSRISTASFEEFLGFLKQRFISAKSTRLQDEFLKMLAINVFDGQKTGENFKLVEMLFESFDILSPKLQRKIREKGPEFFNSFWQRSDLTDEHIRLLSKVFGRDEESVRALISFMKEVAPYQAHGYGGFYRSEEFENYMELAQQQGVVKLIQQLAEYGYTFTIGHSAVLKTMVSRGERIVEAVVQIREIFPDFKYMPEPTNKFNPVTQKLEGIDIGDPYEILFHRISVAQALDTLYTFQEQQGSFSRAFSDGLLNSLRASFEDLDEATYQQFDASLKTFLNELFSPEGKIREHSELYSNINVLRYLARNPQNIDEILSLQETVPLLFELLREGGALYANRVSVWREIFANGSALVRAQEIVTVFTQKEKYWQQLFLFTELRLGGWLDSSTSEYPIVELEDVPIKDVVAQQPEGTVIDDVSVAQKLIAGELSAVPFSALTPKYKRLVYRDYLRRTIVLSQREKTKQQADIRNREQVREYFVFEDGDYIHGSPVDVIEQVLLYGNLPYESLGAAAKVDSYPFHVDFTRLTSQYMEDKKGDVEKIIDKSLSSSYGAKGKFYGDGQLWYVYKRSLASWEHGINYGPSDYHALILGGMPATEISSIVLRNPASTLETVKRAVLENGFYIPIYDLSGQLLFKQSEYDEIRDDLNLSVPVTTWDFSMKTGEQKGSNPGAEFTVPESDGPVKYYVKFGVADALEHIWVETLADLIYRALGIFVPETQIVKVDGGYGHASRILPLDGLALDPNTGRQLKDGFLADSLLANWDIPYAYQRNTALSDGNVYRLDNGGALIFRARGQRKSPEEFGPESSVRELEIGTNTERLGLGMRQVYEKFGLTDADVLTQANSMRDRLTDAVINEKVDSVRLSRDTRDFLKRTLKHRRDYILEKYGVKSQNPQLENTGELKASSSLDYKKTETTKDNLGGIDLNPALYRLRIKRDDHGVPLPMLQQPADVQNINIDGLFPVIINIVPVKSLPGVLLSASAKSVEQ